MFDSSSVSIWLQGKVGAVHPSTCLGLVWGVFLGPEAAHYENKLQLRRADQDTIRAYYTYMCKPSGNIGYVIFLTVIEMDHSSSLLELNLGCAGGRTNHSR